LNGNHEMYTLRGSTLLRLLDAGDFPCAADQCFFGIMQAGK